MNSPAHSPITNGLLCAIRSNPMNKGRFITLEGGEGVGKTSALTVLAQTIRDRGIDLVVTREPGGTPLGERLRELLLGSWNVCPEAELMMIFAARVQHVQEVIGPALDAGRWVLSDRFVDASYAYQGGGRLLPKEPIRMLEELAIRDMQPDLTLLLDAPVEVGLQRVNHRGPLDRFESAGLGFLERVRAAYLQRAREFPDRICVVDAGRPPEIVLGDLVTTLNDRFANDFGYCG